jgi:hypothetical protein
MPTDDKVLRQFQPLLKITKSWANLPLVLQINERCVIVFDLKNTFFTKFRLPTDDKVYRAATHSLQQAIKHPQGSRNKPGPGRYNQEQF